LNVLTMTNTYLPHVGGVARSVASFTEALRRRGHRVVVVAPTFEDLPEKETDVVRVPAMQNFNGSDFSVRLPIPGLLTTALEGVPLDVVHSHHPFLLGDTALRVAALRDLPVVFTHHTMYEQYTHYVPGNSPALKTFVVELATEYANLCDHIIAPSASVAEVLRGRGVTTPITAVPTGIDPHRFARGDGAAARHKHGIPAGAFVVGHVGRLAPEKNLAFLARAVAGFLRSEENGWFFVVGNGPSREEIEAVFAERGLSSRLRLAGVMQGEDLADAYHAMDVFAFASQSETQGMVLAETMTAGVPVVAVDAPGVREVVKDGEDGRLLEREDEAAFAEALRWVAARGPDGRRALAAAARATAESFSLELCADSLLEVYGQLLTASRRARAEDNAWTQVLRRVETEWQLLSATVGAAVKAIGATLAPEESEG
jgi:glycosyltransferase involved in cell wall biosynthesis